MRRPAVIVLAALLAAPAIGAHVRAHVNDRGMDYRTYKDTGGVPCCSKEDCQPAEEFVETVENGQEVVRLLIDGVWITVQRMFVVQAPATDNRAHWCGLKLKTGNPRVWRPGTRCIILPPRVL